MAVKKRRGVLAGIFGENVRLKLVSLGLAILLELYFYSPDNSVTASLDVALDLNGVPQDVVVVEPNELETGMTAILQVRGPRPLIDQARSTNYRFKISPPSSESMEFSVALDPEQLSLPSGVHVVRLRPDIINVRLEKAMRKELEVHLQRSGEPAPGYRIEEVRILPSRILVRGPISQVEGLTQVQTAPLDLTGISANLRRELALQGLGSLVAPMVNMVAVEVNVSEQVRESILPHTTVQLVAPAGYAATVLPSKVSLLISAPLSQSPEKLAENARVSVDLSELEVGKHLLVPRVDLPEGASLLKITPPRVTVIVEPEK